MGSRGPLKVPKHLRAVDDEERAGTVAEEVTPAAPDHPSGFPSGDAGLAALWDEVAAKLDADGLLAACDGPTLEIALRHFLLARRAADEVMSVGLVVQDKAHTGVKKNPIEAVFRSESLAFLEYAKQLGMSFAARARMPSKEHGDGDENPFRATGS